VSEWRDWSDDRKLALKERLADEVERRRTLWDCGKAGCNGRPHEGALGPHARANQLPPKDKSEFGWAEWLLMAGRGFGKTRSGAEFIRSRVRMGGPDHRVALIGRTAADVRDTMIEGESGLLSVYPRWERPKYEPSKRRIQFANGARAFCYSSDEPDQLRGPQHHTAWLDEVATFGHLGDVLSNYRMGLRLGRDPRAVMTTTPKVRPEIVNLVKDEDVVVTRGATYANLANLAPSFRRTVLSKYEGTRLGRQELDGELLDDVEGALWSLDTIDRFRVHVADLPSRFDRVVVAIDPAATVTGDETGIVVVGSLDNEYYVLDDQSMHASPDRWASVAINAAVKWGAWAIVAETNNGGDMVGSVVKAAGYRGRYQAVTATRGKRMRAEPIATLYERGQFHHVGVFPQLEEQQVTWTPDANWSPDRLDAMVWGATTLSTRSRGFASVA
jgi:phage terminase large subunit-like protein